MDKHRHLSSTILTGITYFIISICLQQSWAAHTGAFVVRAQETSANIQGTVKDANGAVVPGVKITVINDDRGLQRETTTGDEGFFIVPLLPPGAYTLTAEMPGFATVRVVEIVLQASINYSVPIVLKPAPVAVSVTVEANSNQIDTTNATVKYSVTNEQVTGLPVVTSTTGRNPLNLLPFLVPGVTPTTNYATANFTVNSLGNDMSVNGSRTTSISFNFEGGDHNEYEGDSAASSLPNPDALQEFTILTNNYQADQGRSSGAVINAVSKSGGNELHGNLRYYIINDALNARGFFDQEVPTNRLHTFGGQLGGPVVIPKLYKGRDRTFFFFDFEGTRSSQGNLFTATVPTLEERRGDFSRSPLAEQPRDPRTGRPFPGGIIPESRLNPLARAYLDRFVPLPNNGGNNFIQELLTNFRADQFTARADHNMGSRDQLRATFFYSSTKTDQEAERFPIGTRRLGKNETRDLIVGETHTFSPRTVNQLAVTWVKIINPISIIAPGITGVDPSSFGFTGIHPQSQRFLALPTINIPEARIRIDASGGFEDFSTTWQVKDDLSYTRGNHAFKFGGDVLSFSLTKFTGNNNGSFNFQSFNLLGTRNVIADLLLGLPATFSQDTGNVISPRQQALSLYAMDDWRARPNLTLNLGLRYEYVRPFRDTRDQVSVFRPGARSHRFVNAPTGLLFAGDPDPILGTVPRTGYPADKNNFAPRLGLAYSPKPKAGWLRKVLGDSKTAIRLGFGVFYDATLGRSFTDVRSTQPFSVRQSLTASRIRSGGGSLANPFGFRNNPFPIAPGRGIFTGLPMVQPFDPTFRTAYTYHYNLMIQRELPGAMLLEIAYVGNNSFKQNRERQLNLATVGPDATPENLQERRLFPELGDILSQESTGRSRYDSAQLRISRRFRGGLAFDASYVFSKTLDDASTTELGMDANPLRWARSDNDRRHNFVVSYTYDVPAFHRKKGLLGRFLSGWEIGGVTEFRSGTPFDLVQIDDLTLTGTALSSNPDFVGPYIRLDPHQFQTIIVDGVPQSGNFFFDPNAFRRVIITDFTQAREGSLGRNVFDGPGINLWSLSLVKRFRIVETQNIELRADIRNLFNRALFAQPNTSLDDLTPLGIVTSAGPGRTIQLSVRYSF